MTLETLITVEVVASSTWQPALAHWYTWVKLSENLDDEHIGDIEHARDTPVALHMRRAHPDNPFNIQFSVIESIKKNGRGGDIDRLLQQKESTWIYRLKSLSPQGLNDILSFRPFLWLLYLDICYTHLD